MQLEVSLSPALYPFRTLQENPVTVAIDVLRATTAVCAAFQAGCDEVVPLDSLDELPGYHAQGYALAAERGGRKVDIPMPDGGTIIAEYGNSPTEYLRHNLSGLRLAYSTTNGTRTIVCAGEGTLCGSFANLSALADRLVAENKDTVLLCSGWQNDFCIEDTLVAGAIIEKLSTLLPGSKGDTACDRSGANSQLLTVNDAAHMALTLWRLAKDDPYAYCQQASHVHRLYRLGAKADVEFAFHLDTCPVVPRLHNGTLIC